MGAHAATDSEDSDQADSDAEVSEGGESSEAEGSDDDASEGTDSGDEDARTSKVGGCWMASRAGDTACNVASVQRLLIVGLGFFV
jgi:hypothetical protein